MNITDINDLNTIHRLYIFTFSINAIVGSVLVLTGIVGNIISIIVLSKDWSRSSMSVLLSVLGIYDILYLILTIYYIILIRGIYQFSHYMNNEYLYTEISYLKVMLMTPMWYLGHFSRCGRNWIAVVVAIDRFVVVYRPFQAQLRSNPTRAKIYSLVVTVICLLYNIPKSIEWKRITVDNNTRIIPNTDLGRLYGLIYGSISFAIVNIAGPTVLLIIFNTLLTISVIKASKRRRILLNNQTASTRRTHETKMLVVVIAVFIITESPSCVWQIIMQNFESQESCRTIILSLVDILSVLNSSLNFFIYCICGQRFRQNLRKLFHFHCTISHSTKTSSNVGSLCLTGYLKDSRYLLSVPGDSKFDQESTI